MHFQGWIQVPADLPPLPFLTAKSCKFNLFWGYISQLQPNFDTRPRSYCKSWIQPWFRPLFDPTMHQICDILLLAITIFKTRLLKKIRCKKLYSSGAIIHLPSAEQWLRGRSRYELNRPCPPPPIWQLNHANSAYFGAISANYPPILTLGPLFLQILDPALSGFSALRQVIWGCMHAAYLCTCMCTPVYFKVDAENYVQILRLWWRWSIYYLIAEQP